MRPLRVLVLVASSALVPDAAAAGEEARAEDPTALFAEALDALAGERPGEAIAKLEALGDRGVVDPVVSFDRGLAYASRVRAGNEQPGDLGRAAHGFEEARELSSDPKLVADATRALATVRAEVARRRARAGEPAELEAGDSLGRAIAKLLPENVWAALAAVFAAALAIGLVVRARAEAPRVKVAGNTTIGVAGALLAVTALLTLAARDLRLHLREAVVVAADARLLDERHVAVAGAAPLPEGARVRLLGEGAGFDRVAVGGAEGWLPSSAVRPLAKP